MDTIYQENTFHDQSTALDACYNKVARLNNCIEIANLINSELALGKLLSSIMETTKAAFQADSVSLLLREEKTSDLVFQIALGDVGNEIKEPLPFKKRPGHCRACSGNHHPHEHQRCIRTSGFFAGL